MEGAGARAVPGGLSVWCHACRQQVPALEVGVRGEQVLCTACGSDFVERLEENRPQSTASGAAVVGDGAAGSGAGAQGQAQGGGEAPSAAPPPSYLPPNISVSIGLHPGSNLIGMVGDIARALEGGAGPRAGGSAGDFVFHNEAMERILAQLAENHVVRPTPASQSAIASLPRVSAKDEPGLSPSECCPVCQEDYTECAEAVRLPCGHYFHEECILPWLKEQNTCPVCRHKLQTADEESDQALAEDLLRSADQVLEDAPEEGVRGSVRAAANGVDLAGEGGTDLQEPDAEGFGEWLDDALLSAGRQLHREVLLDHTSDEEDYAEEGYGPLSTDDEWASSPSYSHAPQSVWQPMATDGLGGRTLSGMSSDDSEDQRALYREWVRTAGAEGTAVPAGEVHPTSPGASRAASLRKARQRVVGRRSLPLSVVAGTLKSLAGVLMPLGGALIRVARPVLHTLGRVFQRRRGR